MRNGEYSELKAFLAVSDKGSFSQAASALQVSPSALSQIIRRLEQRVGVQLFSRTTRSVKLTESGVQFYHRVSPALQELSAAVSDIQHSSGTTSGVVKIHTTSRASETILAPVIGEFYQRFPDICLDIIVEDALVDITQQGFDIGICLGEFLHNDMIGYPLGGSLRMAAAAAPSYLSERKTPVVPCDLLEHNCLNWRYMADKDVYRWEFYQDERWVSVNVKGSLTTSSRELALSAALQGVGIVFWTEDKLEEYVADGRLVRLLEPYCPPFEGWHLYYYRQTHMSAARRALIDFLKEKYPR